VFWLAASLAECGYIKDDAESRDESPFGRAVI